jgi:hypothetical protein
LHAEFKWRLSKRYEVYETRSSLLVLLGAGFSQAFGIPGTEELTRIVESHYAQRGRQNGDDTAAKVFEHLAAGLKAEFGESYNFEVLLDALEASLQFGEPDAIYHTRPRSTLRPIVELQKWLPTDGLAVLRGIMETAYLLIRKALIEAQTALSDVDRGIIRSLFDHLAAAHRLACVNLNYDEAVDSSVPYLDTGFNLHVADVDGKELDPELLLAARGNQMAHLHGSVYYRFPELAPGRLVHVADDDNRYAGWALTTTGGIYPSMISGLAKSEKLLRPPFNIFYHWATDAIVDIPRVLICGYGVGDLHINAWLAQAAIAHGPNYKLVFITRSNNLDSENDRLRGLLSIAAGYRNVAGSPALEEILRFDDEGFATHRGLAVIRTGVPKEAVSLKRALVKIVNFYR